MKKLILAFTVFAAVVFVSCNSNSTASHEDHAKMNQEENMPMDGNKAADKEIKAVTVTFVNVDPGVAGFMKSLVRDYLSLKNALINGNEPEAASSAGKISVTLKELDKSLFTSEQKKIYDDIEDELREHAEHISKSKIDHQREHFATMSKDIYDLVRAFGAGMTLYHDHCPMAMNNSGAMWLSETKEIRNPYFGDKMMTCGSVEEVFQ